MSAPHPTAIDTADPAPLRIFRSPAPDLDAIADRYRANAARRIPITETESVGQVLTALADCDVDLEEAERKLNRNRLAEIATLIRQLTYGEMIELAAAIWNAGIRIEHGEGIVSGYAPEITAETLPGILHEWSKER